MWPIEHLGGLALLQQQLFPQFNLCLCQDLEVVLVLHLVRLMMDFLHRDLLLRQPLKTFSCLGESHNTSLLLVNCKRYASWDTNIGQLLYHCLLMDELGRRIKMHHSNIFMMLKLE